MRPKNLVRGAFLALAAVLLVVALVREGDAVGDALGRLTPVRLAVSTIAVGVGLLAQMLSWRSLFDGSAAAALPVRAMARVYFVGQLGKYVPGSVWAVIAQAELARRHRVTRAQSAAVALGALAVLSVTGGVVGATALAIGSREAVATYWWALVAVPVGIGLLWPPVFNRLVALGMRASRLAGAVPELTARGLARAVGWALAMWLSFALHAWSLAVDLGARGPADAAVVGGAFALAWVVGFLVVLAPAGAGPREAAFVVALSPVLGTAEALVLALVSRVLMILGDGLAAALVAAPGRTAPPDASDDATVGSTDDAPDRRPDRPDSSR